MPRIIMDTLFNNPYCKPIELGDYTLFNAEFSTSGVQADIPGSSFGWVAGPTGVTLVSDGTKARLESTAAGAVNGVALVPLTTPDYVVEAKVASTPNLTVTRLMLDIRNTDSDNNISVRHATTSPNNYVVRRVVGGTVTILSTRTDLIPTNGDVIRVEDHNKHVRVLINNEVLYDGDVTELWKSTGSRVGPTARFTAPSQAIYWDRVHAYVPGDWLA